MFFIVVRYSFKPFNFVSKWNEILKIYLPVQVSLTDMCGKCTENSKLDCRNKNNAIQVRLKSPRTNFIYYYCLLISYKKGCFFLLFYVFFDVESESEVRMAWILYFMPIYYIIFITLKLGASDQNGLQIRILHRKIHRLIEKISFLYDLKTQKFPLF